MYKRKLLAALLLLALGLSGCGNAAPSVPESNAPSTDSAQTEVPEPTLEERQLAAAKEYTENLTLEEQVSQLFFARCPDVNAAEQAAEYSPGGFLLFGRDFDGKTADEVQSDIASYQSASAVPMLIGADEEGGTVVRVSSNPLLRESRFASPQRLYAEGGLDRIRSDTAEKDALLLSLGVNVNLAPVCDISSDSASFIYPRTLGGDATETSDFV
ncbi:MAG: beta-hexosaminidase, partial [Butyricicoccus sp.]|nr:beta-hexosaminidase [Butyricicoccus sp.]